MSAPTGDRQSGTLLSVVPAAERHLLRRSREVVVEQRASEAPILDVLQEALAPHSFGEPIARATLRQLSDELYVLAQAVTGEDFLQMEPQRLRSMLIAMQRRAEAAAELDERICDAIG